MNPDEHFDDDQRAVARAITDADLAALRAGHAPEALARPGRRGATPLAYAIWCARAGEPERLAVVAELVRLGVNPLAPIGPTLGSALEVALGALRPALLETLLDAGVSPDARVSDGAVPALREAIEARSSAHRALLLDRGADPDERDDVGRSAIFWALCELQLDTVDELLDRGANPWVIDLTGLSFGQMLEGLLADAEPAGVTATRLALLRDRVTRMGMPWPPATRAEERARMRSLGVEPLGPDGPGHDF